MTRAEERDETFDLLRDLPVEMSVEEVGTLVAAFAVAPSAASWLSSLNINLNTMIITGAGASIIATTLFLMNPGESARVAEYRSTPAIEAAELPSAPTEMVLEAVPLTMPPVEEPSRTEPLRVEVRPTPLTPQEILPPAPAIVPSGPRPPEDAALAPVPTKDFDLKGFERVVVQGALNVHIEQGEFAVRVSGDAALADRLELRVEGKTLTIGGPNGNYDCKSTNDLGVEVRMPVVEHVALNGSGDVTMGEFTITGALDLAVHGSGDIRFAALAGATALHVELAGSGDVAGTGAAVSGKTRVEVAGSGDVRLSGKTDELVVDVQGSGDVSTSGMQSRECSVRVHGSGDVRVSCSGTLHTNVAGSGEVTNSGDAREIGSDDEGNGSN